MDLWLRVLLWTAFAGGMGALPLASAVGRWGLRTDIRRYGDGNPGAMNVLRAGGWGWFVPALVLEVLKGAVPLWLARTVGELSGWALAPPALAAPVGHAFSPWLRFRGGKAIAVTFGVWSGLTEWRVPVLLGGLFAAALLWFPPEARAVRVGMLALDALLGVAVLVGWVPLSLWLIAWGHTALLFWTHHAGSLADGAPRVPG